MDEHDNKMNTGGDACATKSTEAGATGADACATDTCATEAGAAEASASEDGATSATGADAGATKTNESLSANPALYRKRITKVCARCAGVEFDLAAINWRVAKHLDALATDDDGQVGNLELYASLLVAYGVTAIRGLKNEAGEDVPERRETVSVLGKDLLPLTLEFVDWLDIRLVSQLGAEISEMSGMLPDERLRLDFTRPS